jgi:hypothetical protein
MDLARCLEDLLRMLTPLPRLERTGSSVGCSPAPRRPSPSDRRVGSSKKLSGPAQSSCAFGLRLCTSVAPRTTPEASAGRLLELDCSSGYRANRQFPGRDLHPLAFETQEVSPHSETQLTSNLPSCRTDSHFAAARLQVPQLALRFRYLSRTETNSSFACRRWRRLSHEGFLG